MKKHKIIPINTDRINYLQKQLPHITIKEQYETIEILAITFCEGIKQATYINWQLILQKMENHINKLASRNLSLQGKATILNTLILAKTAYLSNIFPIPQEILKQIHKKIFHYIWINKNNEPIARKTLFLPKKKGGINIKEPETHNLAMRAKHLLNLKCKENQPPWTYLATYWLAKDIYKFGKDYHYLKSNSRAKTTNQKTPF